MKLFLIIFGIVCLSEITIYFAEKSEKENLKQFLVYLKDGRIAIVEGKKIIINDGFIKIGDNYFEEDNIKSVIEDRVIEDLNFN